MRIAHFGPFGPNRCGMYEAIHDIIRLDRKRGHTSELVDVGVLVDQDGQRERVVGGHDERSRDGFVIDTLDYDDVADFEVFVLHSNVPQEFLDATKAPVLRVMHERPLSAFRAEQRDKNSPVYTVYAQANRDPRVKLFVHMWPEHTALWRVILPENKIRCVGEPPIDDSRFCPDGPRHGFEPKDKGRVNILIADIPRPDMDAYYAALGVVRALQSELVPGAKVHFYGLKSPLGPWEYIMSELRALGALGETKGMMYDMDRVFRAMDVLVTPHIIATRTMAEAICCGCDVVADEGCRHTLFTGRMEFPEDVAQAISSALADRMTRTDADVTPLEFRNRFLSPSIGRRFDEAYEEALSES